MPLKEAGDINPGDILRFSDWHTADPVTRESIIKPFQYFVAEDDGITLTPIEPTDPRVSEVLKCR